MSGERKNGVAPLGYLLETGTIRITASVLGERTGDGMVATVDITCAPGAATDVADALAQRDNIRFCAQAAGSSDVVAEVAVSDRADLLTVLHNEIPSTPGVVTSRSALVLDTLLTANDWDPTSTAETPGRVRARQGQPPPSRVSLDEADRQIGYALRHDGRLPVSALAARVGLSEPTASRRLIEAEALVIRCEIPPARVGYPVEVRFLINVRPANLSVALRRLSAQSAIRALEVTTGPFNIVGYAAYRAPHDITELLYQVIPQVPDVLATDVSLILRATKRSGMAVS